MKIETLFEGIDHVRSRMEQTNDERRYYVGGKVPLESVFVLNIISIDSKRRFCV